MKTRALLLMLITLAAPSVGLAATAAAAARGAEEMLGPSNWTSAKGLLPDEILEHYRRGEYANRILELQTIDRRAPLVPPDLAQATQTNHGRYALTPAGSLIETTSGTQPAYVMGLPFDDIDPNDPQAATKIVWNYFYATWYRGDCRFLMELLMFGDGGVERRITAEYQTRMYDGAPEVRGRRNPDNLQLQTLVRVLSPADISGILSLTWRFRDADRHDALWTYVPGLRRPRQVSPLNRSDGFMGSDISLDDGQFFDGKPEDFTFRLIGRQDQLILMDPHGVRGEAELLALPEGGWRILWKDIPRIGSDDPDWKGLPWAPVSAVLVRRPVWIVEGSPKDPNYLYGRVLLRFDAETYLGTWASKYDRSGTLVAAYEVSQGGYYNPDGAPSYVAASGVGAQIAENFIFKRATAALFPRRNPSNPADYRLSLPADLFNPDVLVRNGR